jgi:hypothetical protein
MNNWEDQFDAWDAKYQPEKNHFAKKQQGEFSQTYKVTEDSYLQTLFLQ